MIIFEKEDNLLILSYSSFDSSPEWVYRKIKETNGVTLEKTFFLTKDELRTTFDEEDEYAAVKFEVAVKEGHYYRFSRKLMSLSNDLFIDEAVNFERKFFIAERGISIFPKIDRLVENPIYIGGDNEDCIPLNVYFDFLKAFPNSYELNKYASARIGAVLSSYIHTKDDYEAKYQRYLNKRATKTGVNLKNHFSELEVMKYQSILEKLKMMLDDEELYNEAQWQEEILQIILLLYPKYIHVFKETPVRDSYNLSDRKIDFMLVDSSGNTDIVEIKKPFDKCIVTKNTYRDNYIPLRELSGTVMQIEKYIFYLNKWGRRGEEKLTEILKNEISDGFQIKITNPSGIIIMGRKKGLSSEQLHDFEVIKRKYKNVIDIITYDDLIERLEFTIGQWTKTHSESRNIDQRVKKGFS